ncbi:MAG: SulP family inorganic anion transporter [Hyphomicrobiales bacterium]|nr:SulP family inorganic anion transporter [Hyphomicrobiales bacterium]
MAIPLFAGLLPLKPREALRDALAGVTLASMNVPQVLGYTRIALTPVATGLYAAFLPVVAFAVFGSSRHLVVSADSATAAIFSSALSQMAAPASDRYMALAGLVALMTAGLLAIARILKLGFLADFLSHTALVGFLAGVGVQVGAAMLGDMTGVAVASRRTLGQLWQVLEGLPALKAPVLGLSVVVAASIFIGRWVKPQFPVSLVVVVGAIVASAKFDLAGRGFPVVGAVAGGLPALRFPDVSLSDAVAVLPVSLACFVMIIAQSAATARAFAIWHSERVDENADILGLAAANAAAAASGAFVVNGSPTQTGMADAVGARSQAAQIAFAAVVLIVLLFLTGPLQYLPRCVLASIVFTIAAGMIDVGRLRAILAESRGEFMLAALSAAVVVAVGVEQGILFAVAYSLVRHVRHSYRAHAMVLAPDAQGRWIPRSAAPGQETAPGLIVYRYGADLFYANADYFADQLRALAAKAPHPVRWIVVDAEPIIHIDLSAAESLRSLLGELSRKGVRVAFGRVNPYLESDMRRHHILEAVGEDRVFPSLHEALKLVRRDGVKLDPVQKGAAP